MAVTNEAVGTTTTDGTEQTLSAALTGSKTYGLLLNTQPMANGDQLQVTIYVKTASGGTERVAFQENYADVQAEPIKVSVPIPSVYSWKATVKRIAGTDRTYEWVLVSV